MVKANVLPVKTNYRDSNEKNTRRLLVKEEETQKYAFL